MATHQKMGQGSTNQTLTGLTASTWGTSGWTPGCMQHATEVLRPVWAHLPPVLHILLVTNFPRNPWITLKMQNISHASKKCSSSAVSAVYRTKHKNTCLSNLCSQSCYNRAQRRRKGKDKSLSSTANYTTQSLWRLKSLCRLLKNNKEDQGHRDDAICQLTQTNSLS